MPPVKGEITIASTTNPQSAAWDELDKTNFSYS